MILNDINLRQIFQEFDADPKKRTFTFLGKSFEAAHNLLQKCFEKTLYNVQLQCKILCLHFYQA